MSESRIQHQRFFPPLLMFHLPHKKNFEGPRDDVVSVSRDLWGEGGARPHRVTAAVTRGGGASKSGGDTGWGASKSGGDTGWGWLALYSTLCPWL